MINHPDAHEDFEEVSEEGLPTPEELEQNGKPYGGGKQPIKKTSVETDEEFKEKYESKESKNVLGPSNQKKASVQPPSHPLRPWSSSVVATVAGEGQDEDGSDSSLTVEPPRPVDRRMKSRTVPVTFNPRTMELAMRPMTPQQAGGEEKEGGKKEEDGERPVKETSVKAQAKFAQMKKMQEMKEKPKSIFGPSKAEIEKERQEKEKQRAEQKPQEKHESKEKPKSIFGPSKAELEKERMARQQKENAEADKKRRDKVQGMESQDSSDEEDLPRQARLGLPDAAIADGTMARMMEDPDVRAVLGMDITAPKKILEEPEE